MNDELHNQVMELLSQPRVYLPEVTALGFQVFRHQFQRLPAYRRLCIARGAHPDYVESLAEIPAVPTDAFKETRLFAGDEVTHTFRTSGTTGTARGEHHFQTLDVYRASLHPTFERFIGTPSRLFFLAPSPEELPDSSLCFMFGELMGRLGDDESRFFVHLGPDGAWELDTDGLNAGLQRCTDTETPVMLLGTAFAYAALFQTTDDTFALPPGSAVLETGGFKGRAHEITRQELYRAFTDRLGVPRSRCVSEYSMTELSSQTYTDELVRGDQATHRLYAPPWLRIFIVDPLTLKPFADRGRQGLVAFFDLTNVDSVAAIQTSDRGVLHPDGGLELLGRAPDAELRGCSLTIEELLG